MDRNDVQTALSMVMLAGNLIDLAAKMKAAFGATDQATIDAALADIRQRADVVVPAAIDELRRG